MLNNFASTSFSFRGSRIVFLSTKWEMGEHHDVREMTEEGDKWLALTTKLIHITQDLLTVDTPHSCPRHLQDTCNTVDE